MAMTLPYVSPDTAGAWQAAAEAVARNVQSRADIDANTDRLRAARQRAELGQETALVPTNSH